MGKRSDRRRERRVEKAARRPVGQADEPDRLEAERGSPGQAHQNEWVHEHGDLIAALGAVGHSLTFTTELLSLGHGATKRWETAMRCQRCGERYRGPFVNPWRGLSSERPCEGDRNA